MNSATVVLEAFRSLWTPENLVSLTSLRTALSGLSREEQDRGIRSLRQGFVLSGVAIEGRHGISEAERSACIMEGDNLIGYLAQR